MRVLLGVCLLGLSLANWQVYQEYSQNHGKSYNHHQQKRRYAIFQKNLKVIQAHNARNLTYKFGLGPFTDWTAKEFEEKMTGCYDAKAALERRQLRETPELDVSEAADAIDWTAKKCGGGPCVSEVKNQGSCGSCWAFSTTGEIESRSAIANGKMVELSEEELVQCSERNNGCKGGSMELAFQFVKENGGLCQESDYPYTSGRGQTGRCERREEKQCTSAGKISGYKNVRKDASDQLMAAVTKGPVSVAIEADKAVFQHYKSGVITGRECGTKLDHGVLAVGYGTQQGTDFWKVKNSWGPTWGDRGYVLLERGNAQDGMQGECGILEDASYVEI